MVLKINSNENYTFMGGYCTRSAPWLKNVKPYKILWWKIRVKTTRHVKFSIYDYDFQGSQGEFPAILAWILNATESLECGGSCGAHSFGPVGQTLNAQEKHKNWNTKVYSVVVAALSFWFDLLFLLFFSAFWARTYINNIVWV